MEDIIKGQKETDTSCKLSLSRSLTQKMFYIFHSQLNLNITSHYYSYQTSLQQVHSDDPDFITYVGSLWTFVS